jgi:hypothetical protein
MKKNPYKQRARDLEQTLRELRDDLDEILDPDQDDNDDADSER